MSILNGLNVCTPEMDRSVKEMLRLIEEEGDSFAKKAEMYYKKRPELISHVEDFYRMYRALAERYDHVTGELRKNVQSELNSPNSGSGSDFGSEPPSPSVPSFDHTLEPKPSIPKPGHRAAGFGVFLGSGGSSDRTGKGTDDSSSSSESDSDSDDTKELNGDGDGISSRLNQRILELEKELCIGNEKLKEHEKCGQSVNDNAELRAKISLLENELAAADGKLEVSQAEIMNLQRKLEETNLSSEALSVELSHENVIISKLEARVVRLESKLTDSKLQVEDLKVVLSASNQEIEQYKSQLADAHEQFLREKSHLEADISKLEGIIKGLNEDLNRISKEKLQLETSALEQRHGIEELKAAAANSEKFFQEKSHLEAEIVRQEGIIGELKEEIERISHQNLLLKTNNVEHQQLIEKLKAEAASSENFSQERSHLEAHVLKLEGIIKELKKDIEIISQEKLQLEACTLQQQHLIEELKAADEVSAEKFSLERSSLKAEISTLSQSSTLLEAKIMRLEDEKAKACTERDGKISELNLLIEALKQRVAILLLEKDELSLRVNALNEDIRCRDERVRQIDEHLHQLHLEHVKLRREIDEARRASSDLRERVKVLEDEVERQKVVILDGAEGKREAIRQLCFSLEHYRDGYHRLRQVLQGNNMRPPTAIAV